MFDMYSGMFDASVGGGAPAVGQPGHLHRRDLVLQRPGEAAGRNRGGDAGSLPAAQAVGAALGALQGVRRQQASAFQPLELDAERRVEERPLCDHGARLRDPTARSTTSSAARRRSRIYFWRRYEFTLDREWLRDARLPDAARARWSSIAIYPNVKKGADGKYHIHHVNSNESIYGARDTDEDLSAMRGITAAVLRAAEILKVDAEHAGQCGASSWTTWRRSPPATIADALKPDGYAGPRVFVRGLQARDQARRLHCRTATACRCGSSTCATAGRNRGDRRTPRSTRRCATESDAADHGAGAFQDGDRGGAAGARRRGAVHDSGADRGARGGARHGLQGRRGAGQSDDAARRSAGAGRAAAGTGVGSAASSRC